MKYEQYVKDVANLNKVKTYLKNSYASLGKDAKKLMVEHIVNKQNELENVQFYQVDVKSYN